MQHTPSLANYTPMQRCCSQGDLLVTNQELIYSNDLQPQFSGGVHIFLGICLRVTKCLHMCPTDPNPRYKKDEPLLLTETSEIYQFLTLEQLLVNQPQFLLLNREQLTNYFIICQFLALTYSNNDIFPIQGLPKVAATSLQCLDQNLIALSRIFYETKTANS